MSKEIRKMDFIHQGGFLGPVPDRGLFSTIRVGSEWSSTKVGDQFILNVIKDGEAKVAGTATVVARYILENVDEAVRLHCGVCPATFGLSHEDAVDVLTDILVEEYGADSVNLDVGVALYMERD